MRRGRSIAASNSPPTGVSYPGWRFTAAYTYLDEIYTEYTENLINGADLQLQPRRQQDPRHFAERADGAARL